MNVLFIICEGPHDAQFVGRVLNESHKYTPYEVMLKNYPSPLGAFITRKFHSHAVDEICLGKPVPPMVPVCAFLSNDGSSLILPFAVGGIDQTAKAISLLLEIETSFEQSVLEVQGAEVNSFAVLFLYDADSRGFSETTKLFIERFQNHFENLSEEVDGSWIRPKDYPVSLFIFTDGDGETGTLEDLLVELFRLKQGRLVSDFEDKFLCYFEECADRSDHIAHNAKRKKGLLTSCGQVEKKNAGSALTVVIRNTGLLNDLFRIQNDNSQWKRLIDRIDFAFKQQLVDLK